MRTMENFEKTPQFDSASAKENLSGAGIPDPPSSRTVSVGPPIMATWESCRRERLTAREFDKIDIRNHPDLSRVLGKAK